MFDNEGEKELACTFGYDDGSSANPPEADNFRILMQVSIDRVYSHCSLLNNTEKIQDELKREKGMCMDAFGAGINARPPQVPGVSSIGDSEWYRCIAQREAVTEKEKQRARRRCHYHRKNEDSFQYVTRLMGAYGYWFKDLGLARDDSSEIRVVIQNQLFEILDTYAKKYEEINAAMYSDVSGTPSQPTTEVTKNRGDKTLILTLGKPAITFLDYSPPKNILSLLFGRESSLSWSHSQSGWFRLNWNLLQIGGLETLHTRIKSVTFTHAIGFEWQPPWINTAVVQSSLIGRVGYQLSTRGNFTDATCDDRMNDSANRCSLPLLQSLMSVSFLSRIRLELGINWFLPLSAVKLPNHQLNTVFTAAVGFQFLN
ncbi:MAG: hypothetical protein JXX14_10475 [Deltaproteobacteria bacterium]|nr:hypothetical protein [Deltaproteobacteria bacterium]